MIALRWCLLGLATTTLAPAARGGVEPWADRALPVADGLVLWLDAGRQDRAYEAQRLPGVAPGGPLPAWLDGSGRGLHLSQRTRDAWPRLLAAGGRAAVRFDGKDDCLQSSRPGLALDRFTAFVVAAPRSNLGGFRGLLCTNAIGRRDYETGFNIDLGPLPTGRFEAMNVEGRGFGGARNLLDESLAPGTYHTIEVLGRDGPGGVALRIDGRPQGRRDRQPGPIAVDEVAVGARSYSNEPVPCYLQGFFDGDIAEVLLYDRCLAEDEARSVRNYLGTKHAGLAEALGSLADARGKPWPTVADPPPVQVLVPGFIVRELPVGLKNINNVRYRDDGTLVALGYDGDIHLLSDRDGDGLEEHVATFWEGRGRLRGPIGLALTRPGDPRGRGAFVPSKGKLSLILDRDGDDRADEEVVVATGWKELPHGVDALGVAVADDGGVYFGLGAADYTNAYLLDTSGHARYDPAGERGAILRVAPDFRTRRVVATGIRFPVGLAFNRRGDLFATDQEGATWLPNGNPFDELLHIQDGRHYGFPPRHMRHLPRVIDEPSVFDYRPQHQSTCGLQFDEPVNGGPPFGPLWWAGDALVCGYSRGKLYRTELAATRAGYVARSHLLAVLQRLAVDACVAPDGSLVVATHSGGPDWGSGPEGRGTLYKISFADKEGPQPVAAWAESPREARVAFDRPLGVERLRALASGVAIEYGRSVSAGDRYETLRPGYAVVAAQVADPRLDLPVRAAGVTPDRRTLLLTTDPQSDASATYAITLRGLGRPPRGRGPRGDLPQDPAIDLAYGLHGVRAEWRPEAGGESWSGWLPHLDLAAARAFAAGSAEHERLWPLLKRPGRLTLRARLDLKDLLRPAVQPGSRVDEPLPPERVSLSLAASGPVEVRLPGGRIERSTPSAGEAAVRIDLGTPAEPVEVEVAMTTGPGAEPRLDLAYSTAEDSRPRALSLSRLILPWARLGAAPDPAGRPPWPAELAGGSWARGQALFFGPRARCSECHTMQGRGGKIGPDLSNLSQRDYASVLRDVREPSFAVNPDFITYNVALADGRVLSGTVRTEGTTLRIGDGQGREAAVPRGEVEALQPSPTSTMPQGLADALGAEGLRDLLTFLLTPAPEPAPIGRGDAPAPRTRAEVEAVLGPPPPPSDRPPRPLRIVLAGGPKDHGPDEHDYPLWRTRWADLLARAEGVTVETADGWPSAEQLGAADLLVFYSANPAWSSSRGAELDAFLGRGGGLALIHYAVNGRSDPEGLARRIGLAWRDGHSRFRHGPVELRFAGPEHPVTAGFRGLKLVDESYWELIGDPAGVEVLATAVEDGKARPLLWTRRQGRGRVFVSIPGHYTWTFDDPLFRVLLLRGMAWAAGEPVDRFRDLATPGARLAGEAGAK
jgi:putative heme-binding domain-containing protein